jgi:hypothetical protein
MRGLRLAFAAIVLVSLTVIPACANKAPSVAPLGTVIAAEHAHVGQSVADVGTTVYGGDRLSTEGQGTIQVRAGAARLLLLSSTVAEVNDEEGTPSAKLLMGTATFSTGNAHAFTLYASKASVRANTDAPTIGQVVYVSDKELVVVAKRGSLVVMVGDDTQVVNEGTAYRVLLDPVAAETQEPSGAGTPSQGPRSKGGPLKAGRSRFLIVSTAFIAAATTFAILEACESPSRVSR